MFFEVYEYFIIFYFSLFQISSDAYLMPTIQRMRALYGNFEMDSQIKENVTYQRLKGEIKFLISVLNTTVMSRAMQWLSDKKFIESDNLKRQDTLKSIWFKRFGGSTCGFERVFACEVYSNVDILGVQDWIYFNHLEANGKINYLSFADKLELGKVRLL